MAGPEFKTGTKVHVYPGGINEIKRGTVKDGNCEEGKTMVQLEGESESKCLDDSHLRERLDLDKLKIDFSDPRSDAQKYGTEIIVIVDHSAEYRAIAEIEKAKQLIKAALRFVGFKKAEE